MAVQEFAILSDIHANLPALEAVLAEIDQMGIQRILCCGDVVGYGPHPRECIERLRNRGIPCVLGNHDFYTIQLRHSDEARKLEAELRLNSVWGGILHAIDQLGEEDFQWLQNLPSFIQMPEAIMGHAALHDLENWPYLVDDMDILTTLEELDKRKIPLGFFGHSHEQEWFTTSSKGTLKRSAKSLSSLPSSHPIAVVVGSVGQPRTGDPRAAWTLWVPQNRTIEFRRTPYPIEKTIEAIKASGLPKHSALRLLHGE